MATTELALGAERRGDLRIVRAAGRIDFATTPAFQDALLTEAGSLDGSGALIVDLSGVDLITSAGLRVLMQTKKQLSEAGAALIVVGVAGTVADVMRVSRFDTLLTIRSTVEEAVGLPPSETGPTGRG